MEVGYTATEAQDVLVTKYKIPAELIDGVMSAAMRDVDMPLDDPNIERFREKEAVNPRLLLVAASVLTIIAIFIFVIILL